MIKLVCACVILVCTLLNGISMWLAWDGIEKMKRFSKKVLSGINESLTLGNSKGNQKN